jgi:hypothetical protein
MGMKDKQHNMKMYGGVEVQLQAFFFSGSIQICVVRFMPRQFYLREISPLAPSA